jgi:tonB-dependent siderophore receptor
MKFYHLSAPLLLILPVCTQAADAYVPADAESAAVTLSTVTVRGKRQKSLNKGYTASGTYAATGMPLTLREVPQSVSVVTDKQMKDQGKRSVYDALSWVNGISGNPASSRYAVTNMYARGETVNDYQIDGMTTEIDGNQLLNSGAYERVEVVRGTSALQGGVGDPSATVNLVRKRPTKERQAEISVGIGRWRRWNAEADVSGPLNSSGSLRGRAVINAEGGRHWTEGSRDRSDMVYGIAEYDFSPQTTAYAGINHQRAREKEFYGGDLPVYDSAGYPTRLGIRDNNKIKGSRYRERATELFTGLEHRFENNWKAKLEYRYNREKTLNPGMGDAPYNYLRHDDSSAGAKFYKMGDNIVSHAFSFKLNGQYDLWGRKHEAVFGIGGYRTRDKRAWANSEGNYSIDDIYDFIRRRDYPSIASVNDWKWDGDTIATRQISGYAATRLHATDKLSLLLGANYARYHYQAIPVGGSPNTEAKEGRFAPYAGITYDLTGNLSAYASYSRLFKPHENSETDINRRPIDPITGRTVEAGLKGEWLEGRLNASLSVFQSKRRNVPVEAGKFDNDDTYYRAANTKAHGWEAEISGSPAEGWDINAGVQSHLTREENGNRPNSQYDPRHSFKLFTTYRLPKTRWTLGGGVRWQSKTFVDKYSDLSNIEFDDDEAKERARVLSRQKSFAVVDLTAQYDISKNANLTLNFDNVFDKRYRMDTAYHDYGQPRSLSGTLRYKF